jgi:putative transposase
VWRNVLEEGLSCGLLRIERLMRLIALRARRRGLPKDAGDRAVTMPNVLDRQFVAERPNQKWVADFTYIWTAEGWLYVAAVIDLIDEAWLMKSNGELVRVPADARETVS